MKTLIAMRHAKSDWSSPGLADHDRPLNARGRRSAPLIAQKLISEALTADVILASSAKRVQETLQLMDDWVGETAISTEKSLYLATSDSIVDDLRVLDDGWCNVMLIGHNPGLTHLVEKLTGVSCEMPTAAVAVMRSPGDSWASALSAAAWDLVAHWRPRELEASGH